MDESFDVDNFEIPLNEKRTYSVIEVFQVYFFRSYLNITNHVYNTFFFSFGNKYSKKHSNNIEDYHVLY